MAKFLLLLRDDPGQFTSLSAEEMQRIIGEYGAWARGLAEKGKLHGSDKLVDDPGRIVSNHGATVTVKDGPYAETKELISGYFIVEADSYDDALEIARGCPHLRQRHEGTIEVRMIEDLSARR